MKVKSAASFSTGLVLLLAGAHFLHDVFTAFLAPLLPLLIERLGLTLFQAGSLAVLIQIPSVLDPLLGSLVDRRKLHRLFVAIGPAGSGTLMCLIGLAPSYGVLAILLLTAGVSVACLHVAAPVVISRLAGGHVGRGMSFFMVAGELARTVGPLIAVQLVTLFGLDGLWRVAPVAIASSVLLWWQLGRIRVAEETSRPVHLFGVWARMRRVLLAVTGILISRAFMAGALTTFLPTFIYGEGQSLWIANISLSVLELAGAAGAMMSGTLSDRLGRRRVLFLTVASAPPAMLLFLGAEGPARMLVLVFLGLAMLSTAPVLMAVVLEHAGDDPAAANGTYFMISFAARSLILLAVGAMGDAFGLRTAFSWCAFFGAFGIPFVLLLPRSPSRV